MSSGWHWATQSTADGHSDGAAALLALPALPDGVALVDVQAALQKLAQAQK